MTKEEKLNNHITTRSNESYSLEAVPNRRGTTTEYGLRDAGKATHANNDKLNVYNSNRTYKLNGNAYTYKNKGSIRKGKTPEQIKAQLERIDRMGRELDQRDGGVGRIETFRRVQRAYDTVGAYEDYHSLGAKGSSNG